jgi:hypothetical protein
MMTAIGATAVNTAKPTNLSTPMIHAFLDNIRYITIELNGLILYDTRDDLPCDMDKWRKTRARLPEFAAAITWRAPSSPSWCWRQRHRPTLNSTTLSSARTFR